MRVALFIISSGLCVFSLVACNKPTSASGEVSQNVAAAEPLAQDQKHQKAVAKTDESGAQTVAITVGEDGFAPNHVEVKRGGKATLRFTRTTDKTCATGVAFPELGLDKPLPLNQSVDIEIPVDRARVLTFQCGMGMYKSKVVVL